MSVFPWIGIQHFPRTTWKQIAKGKLCNPILGKTDFMQNEVHMHSLVCEKEPASNFDSQLQRTLHFTCSACWPIKQLIQWELLLLYIFGMVLYMVLEEFFCCCFPSPFYFLFKFQDNCLCARIAAVLFLELALSYRPAKHWAFCRKLGFPDLLLFSLGWS